MITKWRLYSRNIIENGNMGRSVALNNGNCVLEVLAVGTVATCWQEEEKIVKQYDYEGENNGGRWYD
jgi:hypothetical protein